MLELNSVVSSRIDEFFGGCAASSLRDSSAVVKRLDSRRASLRVSGGSRRVSRTETRCARGFAWLSRCSTRPAGCLSGRGSSVSAGTGSTAASVDESIGSCPDGRFTPIWGSGRFTVVLQCPDLSTGTKAVPRRPLRVTPRFRPRIGHTNPRKPLHRRPVERPDST